MNAGRRALLVGEGKCAEAYLVVGESMGLKDSQYD